MTGSSEGSERPSGRFAGRIPAAAFLLLLVAASIAVRAVQYRGVPDRGLAPITDPDSLYHYRLARIMDVHYPGVPAFDSFINYPTGADVPWPFLQEFVAVTLHRLSRDSGEAGLKRICFWYPAAIGSLSLPMVYVLAGRLGMSPIPSAVAAVLASLSPAHIAYSTAGRYDHHAADLLLALLFFVAVLAVRPRQGGGRGAAAWSSVPAVAWLSLVVILNFLNWIGCVIYVLILLLAVAATVATRGGRESLDPPFLKRLACALAISALLLGAVWLAAYGSTRAFAVDSGKPSGFQPLFLIEASLLLFLAAPVAGKGGAPVRGSVRLAALAAFVAVAVLLVGALWHGFSYYVVAENRPLMSIAEFRSPLVDPHSDFLRPRWSLSAAGRSLTWAPLLVPFFGWGIWRRGFSDAGEGRFPRVLFLSILGVCALMAARQYRYANVLSVPVAIGSAWTAASLWTARRPGMPLPRRVLALAAVAVVALAYLPGAAFVARKFREPYHDLGNYALTRAVARLPALTPAPSDVLEPRQPPAYGVMAFWYAGHNVIGAGDRPCIATGFLDALPGERFREATRFFTEEDPDRAFEMMAKNRLRYLVLHNQPQALLSAYYILRRDDLYSLLLSGGKDGLIGSGHVPVSLLLWDRRGSALERGGRILGGARHFRLLWQDYFYYPTESALDQTQIYEAVPGASLAGRASPGSLVTASLAAVDNHGNRFVYFDATIAGPDGRFSLVVPYASDRQVGGVRPEGDYRVAVANGARAVEVRVGEPDVLGARTVSVFPDSRRGGK